MKEKIKEQFKFKNPDKLFLVSGLCWVVYFLSLALIRIIYSLNEDQTETGLWMLVAAMWCALFLLEFAFSNQIIKLYRESVNNIMMNWEDSIKILHNMSEKFSKFEEKTPGEKLEK